MPSLGIRHAALAVTDIPRALRFYRDALGFKVVYDRDADWAMISQAGTTLSLIRAKVPSPDFSSSSPYGTHPAHLGVVVDSPEEVDAIHARSRSWEGVSSQPPKLHRDGSYGFYFRDPDGNALECIFIPHQLNSAEVPRPLHGTGILMFAHGSSDPRWREPIERLERAIRRNAPGADVATAYLEFSEPELPEAVERLVERGSSRIFVVPVFISAGGGHMRRDFPALLESIRAKHPGLKLHALDPLGESPETIEAFVSTAISQIALPAHLT